MTAPGSGIDPRRLCVICGASGEGRCPKGRFHQYYLHGRMMRTAMSVRGCIDRRRTDDRLAGAIKTSVVTERALV